jgi:hypothetical protein
MPEKKITITIFLFALFVFLGIFIFLLGYSTTTSSGNYSRQVSKSTIECTGITFDIVGGSMSYENSVLRFTIESFGGGSASRLVVASENETWFTPQLDFRADVDRKIKIENITIKDKFRIYPEGCDGYNVKECDLKECVIIK